MTTLQAHKTLEQLLEAVRNHSTMPNDSALVNMAQHYMQVEQIHHDEMVWSRFTLVCIIAAINLVAAWIILTIRYRKDLKIQEEKRKRLLMEQQLLEQAGIGEPVGSEGLEALKASSIYLQILDCLDKGDRPLSEDEWEQFKETFQEALPYFRTKLLDFHPKLSLIQYRICILVKCELAPVQIAQLVGRSKSAISMARSELYLRITGEKGTPSQLDKLMKGF